MGNGNVQRIKVLLASLVAVIAAIADIYVIVNMPDSYILLGGISLLLLVAVYLVISGKMQLRDLSGMKSQEQYNKIINSQKACYIQVRRGFRETSGKINQIDKKIEPLATAGEVNHQRISALLNALMQDQKKLAKLTVSRSKENANALMNSNDKVIEEMLKIQEVMNNIVDKTDDSIQDNQSEEFVKAEERQQELLAKMQRLEDSLKSQLEAVSDSIQKMPEIEKEVISELKTELKSEPVIEEIVPEPEPEVIEEEIIAEPEAKVIEEEIMPEPEPEVIEEKIAEPEPEVIEEEKIAEPEPEVIEEEKIAEPEPVAVDSNKMLTPEEIAALIAGSKEELPEAMEEPAVEEAVEAVEAVEEASVVPDLSDPNKPMSPEEIAALIASM